MKIKGKLFVGSGEDVFVAELPTHEQESHDRRLERFKQDRREQAEAKRPPYAFIGEEDVPY
jgi:hypothetical protein